MQFAEPEADNCTMDITSAGGISETGRARMAKILQRTAGPIRTRDAAAALGMDPKRASWLLSSWVRRGWLQRVARGVYMPVPIEARTGTRPAADPWAVAATVFAPCYVTGWSAAEHWDLTEQLYRVTAIVSARSLRSRRTVAGGAEFLVITRQLPSEGRVSIWRGAVQVDVADPSLTLVDMLDDPRLGPGIREAARSLVAYLRSARRDDDALIRLADARGNGAVFKRLGWLIEQLAPLETPLRDACLGRLTQGYARLDPSVAAPGRRRTRWRVIENVVITSTDTRA